VAAAAEDDDDDTETEDRPGSPSSVCARTRARRGSKPPAPPTTGKPNVWLYGLLSAPPLPSTSDVSPRLTAPVAGGELGCGIRPRGRARYWTGMRRRCPESGCVRGNVQAPVMRQKLRHGNCVVNSRCLNLNPSWNFVNESGIGQRR
jgi:hypothetical protein